MENQNSEAWHLYENLNEEERKLHELRRKRLKNLTAEEALLWEKVEASRKAWKLFDAKRQLKLAIEKRKAEPKWLKVILKTLIYAFIAFGLLIVFFVIISDEESEQSKKESELRKQEEIIQQNVAPFADGTVYCCKMWLKANLNDWDSYESLEWSEPVRINKTTFSVTHKFRAANGFGVKTISIYSFTYDGNCKVLSVSQQ